MVFDNIVDGVVWKERFRFNEVRAAYGTGGGISVACYPSITTVPTGCVTTRVTHERGNEDVTTNRTRYFVLISSKNDPQFLARARRGCIQRCYYRRFSHGLGMKVKVSKGAFFSLAEIAQGRHVRKRSGNCICMMSPEGTMFDFVACSKEIRVYVQLIERVQRRSITPGVGNVHGDTSSLVGSGGTRKVHLTRSCRC